MKRFTTFDALAKKLTWEQAKSFLSEADIKAGQQRGKLTTQGPWGIPVSYKALATTQIWEDSVPWDLSPGLPIGSLRVFGPRTLTGIRQDGHALEGRVSINGKSYRAFTSSQLFELPDGTLVDVAILHVCGRTGK